MHQQWSYHTHSHTLSHGQKALMLVLNKLLNKQSSCLCFETIWCSCDATVMIHSKISSVSCKHISCLIPGNHINAFIPPIIYPSGCKWQQCHSPVTLTWMGFTFITTNRVQIEETTILNCARKWFVTYLVDVINSWLDCSSFIYSLIHKLINQFIT